MPSAGLDLVDQLGGIAGRVPWPLLLVAAVAFFLLVGAIRRRAGRPRTGEIWFAQVPFRDGTGSKDRPVLVLSVDGRACTVAQFTSQDRDARRDYLRVPDASPA
ncbi:type II toxin-antitoxin system PemK/MazF family toxin [Pengzhenrongella phosphoraccumulans]|uniref:type II toxin-antitoxin system PemK/MazF family toxin n=1 Tax=Pengzhenrongella phosphoraccumulans TaxID=3114394 RepID=UPI003890D5A8